MDFVMIGLRVCRPLRDSEILITIPTATLVPSVAVGYNLPPRFAGLTNNGHIRFC